MCGIMGVMLDKRERSTAEWHEIKLDITNIFIQTQVRGIDASGMFVVNGKGIAHYKRGMKAGKLVQEKGYWELLDRIDASTTAVVGHTRAATMGKPSMNNNNHPLIDGNIIGVHNGMLTNSRELRKQYPHEAEVDSASIFAMLNSLTKSEPLDTTTMSHAMTQLRGNYAVVTADIRKLGSLFFAKDDQRPLVMFYEEARGLLWFASTAEIIDLGLPDDVELEADLWFNDAKNVVTEITTDDMEDMRRFFGIDGLCSFWKITPIIRREVIIQP